MPFETLQKVFGEEAEPDWVQFQSRFVFAHRVLIRVHVECFLDSPLQTMTFASDQFHIVEVKGMLHAPQKKTCQIVLFGCRTRAP